MSRNPETARVELHWVYKPADFFEAPITLERADHRIDIDAGRVTARLTAAAFDAWPDARRRLALELESYFQGIALAQHKDFQLSKGGLTRIDPDGRQHHLLQAHIMSVSVTPDHVELIVTDPDGTVHDSRRERIENTQRRAELAARVAPNDPTARKLLECYQTAIRDPANELVHLYEIWEGLVEAFGGKKKKGIGAARQTLNIDEGRLTRLACNEPLKQGRHRGCHLHSLRDATQPELDEARSIARDMLIRYLEFKD